MRLTARGVGVSIYHCQYIGCMIWYQWSCSISDLDSSRVCVSLSHHYGGLCDELSVHDMILDEESLALCVFIVKMGSNQSVS
jgi:hypothetical protein